MAKNKTKWRYLKKHRENATSNSTTLDAYYNDSFLFLLQCHNNIFDTFDLFDYDKKIRIMMIHINT